MLTSSAWVFLAAADFLERDEIGKQSAHAHDMCNSRQE
jgi:hypothetical protein